MNIRTFGLATSLGLAALLGSTLARADDRLDQAIYHVNEAITQGGKLHDTGLLSYHADLALEKAEGLQKFKPNPHLAEAIVHIKAAIEEGRANHAEAGTAQAKEALSHLEEASKESAK
ncbi:small metal-binding protein SmbP [Methylosinus sporium]|uniref:small metal-binding protein SmbP n=1 Tax=Methylosinus sporium TaxID=428 RepID=UPI00383B1D4B